MDETHMGGSGSSFDTTRWTQILLAGGTPSAEGRMAMNVVVADYWKPVYSYLRRKGYPNERAKDLTQGFFAQVVLGRRLISRADPAKGRFRVS